MHLPRRLLIAALSAAATLALPAATILYNPAGVSIGYAAANSTQFTTALNTALGATGTSTADFSNLSQVLAADLVFVNIRSGAGSLSAPEVTNLQAFAATGRPIFMLGDNYTNFGTWNTSVLGAFGGAPLVYFANLPGTNVVVQSHPIFASITSLSGMVNPGYILSGGTPLLRPSSFSAYAIASLFGPSNNVFILLDVNVLADTAGNTQFGSNVGAWSASVVPEPATWGLLAGAAALGLALVLRRRQRPAAHPRS